MIFLYIFKKDNIYIVYFELKNLGLLWIFHNGTQDILLASCVWLVHLQASIYCPRLECIMLRGGPYFQAILDFAYLFFLFLLKLLLNEKMNYKKSWRFDPIYFQLILILNILRLSIYIRTKYPRDKSKNKYSKQNLKLPYVESYMHSIIM